MGWLDDIASGVGNFVRNDIVNPVERWFDPNSAQNIAARQQEASNTAAMQGDRQANAALQSQADANKPAVNQFIDNALNSNPVTAAIGAGGFNYSTQGGFGAGTQIPSASTPTSPQPNYDQIVSDAASAYQPGYVDTSLNPIAPDSGSAPGYHMIGDVNGTNWNGTKPGDPLPMSNPNAAPVGVLAPPPDPNAPIAGQTVISTGGAAPAATAPTAGSNPLAWQDWIAQHPSEAAAIFGAGVGGVASGVGAVVQANAAQQAAQAQVDAANRAVDLQRDQFNQQQANLKPWLDAGKTALGQLGDLTSNANWKPFDASQFQQDPGYQFRLSEGMKALQNSAAARGQLLSGNTMKGITNYAQGAASDEYNNAFNRYQTERNSRLNSLQSLAGVGQTATQQLGQAGQNYATNAGNALVGAGQAQAQGITGAGSANASGWVGGANALTNALSSYSNYNQSNQLLNALLKNGG